MDYPARMGEGEGGTGGERGGWLLVRRDIKVSTGPVDLRGQVSRPPLPPSSLLPPSLTVVLYHWEFYTVSSLLLSHPNFTLNFVNMAGGGGKPQNIFRLNRGDDPKEVLNWRLWFAVFSFGIMGAARGSFLSLSQHVNKHDG